MKHGQTRISTLGAVPPGPEIVSNDDGVFNPTMHRLLAAAPQPPAEVSATAPEFAQIRAACLTQFSLRSYWFGAVLGCMKKAAYDGTTDAILRDCDTCVSSGKLHINFAHSAQYGVAFYARYIPLLWLSVCARSIRRDCIIGCQHA